MHYKQVAESKGKEEELKQRLRDTVIDNQSLDTPIDSLLRRFILLDMNASLPSSIFDELLALCRKSSPDCCRLLDELDNADQTKASEGCFFISRDSISIEVFQSCARPP